MPPASSRINMMTGAIPEGKPLPPKSEKQQNFEAWLSFVSVSPGVLIGIFPVPSSRLLIARSSTHACFLAFLLQVVAVCLASQRNFAAWVSGGHLRESKGVHSFSYVNVRVAQLAALTD